MTKALRTANIKTILFILRIIDTEEEQQGRAGVDPYIPIPETLA
jgi:hypothetical protein